MNAVQKFREYAGLTHLSNREEDDIAAMIEQAAAEAINLFRKRLEYWLLIDDGCVGGIPAGNALSGLIDELDELEEAIKEGRKPEFEFGNEE